MKNIKDLCDQLNVLGKEFYATAKSKGFHDEPVPWAVMIANIHGETSELWEAFRNQTLNKLCDKSEKMIANDIEPLTCAEEELADILIRVLDTAEEYNIDIGRAVYLKAEFNKTRSHKNGGKLV